MFVSIVITQFGNLRLPLLLWCLIAPFRARYVLLGTHGTLLRNVCCLGYTVLQHAITQRYFVQQVKLLKVTTDHCEIFKQ